MAVLGDDCAQGTATKMATSLWVKTCADSGMTLKARQCRFYCDLTFLSRFFVPKGQDNCMVPLIGKALCRFNARANRNQDVSDDQYICGKALSYAFEFRHVGYLRDAFLARARLTNYSFDDVVLQDLTWFAKQNVRTVEDVCQSILNEAIVLSDDEFLEVIMAKYDIGLYDMDDLRDRLILSDVKEVFSDERYYQFEHEVG